MNTTHEITHTYSQEAHDGTVTSEVEVLITYMVDWINGTMTLVGTKFEVDPWCNIEADYFDCWAESILESSKDGLIKRALGELEQNGIDVATELFMQQVGTRIWIVA